MTLTVNSKPPPTGARNVLVKPIANEYGLRQLDMVETNRKKVDAGHAAAAWDMSTFPTWEATA